MKILRYILLTFTAALALSGCQKDNDFLSINPNTKLVDDQVWKNSTLIYQQLADLYSQYADYQHNGTWYTYCDFDEAYCSNAVDRKRHTNATYDYGMLATWNYTYIRYMNLFIQKCQKVSESVMSPADRDRYVSEARFLRACYYFYMAKVMGGVPLITEPMSYDYSGDVTPLQKPRNKEYEVYDFVISEMEAIKNLLPDDANIKSRATKGAALAVEARAALYAGSIAKYGAKTPTVKTDGWEVGIPADKAEAYYKKALSAAQEIINGKKYSLYKKNTTNLSENFASIFTDKSNNPEAIFVQDYLAPTKTHNYTLYALPKSMADQANYNGSLCPSLNLVSLYEKLDNTFASFNIGTTTDPVCYEDPLDLFAGRDARLAGTVILPGASFRDKKVDVFAGWYDPSNGTTYTSGTLGQSGDLPDGRTVQLVGKDGPIEGVEYNTHTGFYVRKNTDTKAKSGAEGTLSDVWFIRYRYAEVLLNAAEAAFELGQTTIALPYINEVRKRAGFTTDLVASDISFNRIAHERKVELAMEGHEFFDMKRWRIAHVAWNGESMTNVNDPSNPSSVSTQIFGLVPYKVYAPGTAKDGKYMFVVKKPSWVSVAHEFRLGNYYTQINSTILGHNPQIVKQPNQ